MHMMIMSSSRSRQRAIFLVLLLSCLAFNGFPMTVDQEEDLEPAPPPSSGSVASFMSSAPVHVISSPAAPSPEDEGNAALHQVLTPAPGQDDSSNQSPPAAVMEEPAETGSTDTVVRWCAVRDDEFVDCQYHLSLLRQTDDGFSWKCVRRETTQQCLESIKKGEADLINLEAGLAYVAFINYSMKAIANEVYCNHAGNYKSVAVVNRKACSRNGGGGGGLSLRDFKGQRSCHGGYATAAGWNYPASYLKQFVKDAKVANDQEIVSEFFSAVCAPSEFEGTGDCSGCGHGNGHASSSPSGDWYSGFSGAFRCLVEGLGDIAFVKEDTPLLFSMEGPHKKSWSTKSINQFMYLCPQGGCREINGYPGDCIFGTIPANVLMAPNFIPSKKKETIVQTLMNATWDDALYSGRNGDSHLLSYSAQKLIAVKQLTRSYLGESASISQSLQRIGLNPADDPSLTAVLSVSDSPGAMLPWNGYPWIAPILPLLVRFVVDFV